MASKLRVNEVEKLDGLGKGLFATPYEAGVTLYNSSDLILHEGSYYRVSEETSLPYITSGAWEVDGPAMVLLGDDVLRQELGAENGALMVRGAVIYVDTIADLQALDMSRLVDGQQARVSGEGFYRWDGSLQEWVFDLVATQEIVFNIPGDFGNLKDFVEHVDETSFPSGYSITLEIDEGNYSGAGWDTYVLLHERLPPGISIIGKGAGAIIEPDVNGTDGVGISPGLYKPFLHIKNYKAGVITGIEINIEGTAGNNVGALLVEGQAYAETDATYKVTTLDDDVFGVFAIDGAVVNARGATVDGCGNRDEFDPGGVYENGDPNGDAAGNGFYAWGGATILADNASAKRCGRGLNISRASRSTANSINTDDCVHHAILATRGSVIYCNNAIATNALDDCIVAIWGSTIIANGADASGAKETSCVIANSASFISFIDGVANDAGGTGVVAMRASKINALGVTCNNSGNDGIRAETSSEIYCENGTITNSGRDNIGAHTGGTVSARFAVATGATRYGVYAFEMGTITCDNVDARNCGDSGLYVTRCSRVNARNGDFRNSGVVSDVQMYQGSWIDFHGAQGNIQGTITQNDISDKGVFFV